MWIKISGLETNPFELKMMVKSGLDFFLKFNWPLQLPAKMPSQFNLSGQIFFALDSSKSEGASRISKQKI